MARLIVKKSVFQGRRRKTWRVSALHRDERERVKFLPDDRPPTSSSRRSSSKKLTKDFPDTKTLLEYGDYAAHPTKFNASQFLTLAIKLEQGAGA